MDLAVVPIKTIFPLISKGSIDLFSTSPRLRFGIIRRLFVSSIVWYPAPARFRYPPEFWLSHIFDGSDSIFLPRSCCWFAVSISRSASERIDRTWFDTWTRSLLITPSLSRTRSLNPCCLSGVPGIAGIASAILRIDISRLFVLIIFLRQVFCGGTSTSR